MLNDIEKSWHKITNKKQKSIYYKSTNPINQTSSNETSIKNNKPICLNRDCLDFKIINSNNIKVIWLKKGRWKCKTCKRCFSIGRIKEKRYREKKPISFIFNLYNLASGKNKVTNKYGKIKYRPYTARELKDELNIKSSKTLYYYLRKLINDPNINMDILEYIGQTQGIGKNTEKELKENINRIKTRHKRITTSY